jgi:hypothetical protein
VTPALVRGERKGEEGRGKREEGRGRIGYQRLQGKLVVNRARKIEVYQVFHCSLRVS